MVGKVLINNEVKGRTMNKKIMFAGLVVIMVALPALAVSVCAKNSIVTVVLDPTLGISGYTYNNAASVWKATASYGTITGISTCIATSGTFGVANPSVESPGGETTGGKCWCKMTHPMASRWVFNYDYGSASNCASDCTYYCGFRVQYNGALRVGLFGSVSQ